MASRKRERDPSEEPEKEEIIPAGATEIPEWPKGPEWYATFYRPRLEKFIARLPKGYLFEAMARMAKQLFTPKTEAEEKAQLEYFQADEISQIVVARVLELIGYERKNNSRIGELDQLRARCMQVIFAYQRYVKDIDYLIEKHHERQGRIVAEKDYIKAMVVTTMGDEALKRFREDRNQHLMNKFMKEMSNHDFPKPIEETRTRTRHRTKYGNAGKDKIL